MAPKEPPVSPDVAYRGVGGPVIAGSAFGDASEQRWLFYLFCRQQGLWPKEVAGYDPGSEPRAFDPFCPVRNVSKDYPTPRGPLSVLANVSLSLSRLLLLSPFLNRSPPKLWLSALLPVSLVTARRACRKRRTFLHSAASRRLIS